MYQEVCFNRGTEAGGGVNVGHSLSPHSHFMLATGLLCSAVCCHHLHPSLLLAPLNFKSAFFAPENFSVSNLPLRGLTIRRSCVCCSVCMRNGLRFTDSKHCFAHCARRDYKLTSLGAPRLASRGIIVCLVETCARKIKTAAFAISL